MQNKIKNILIGVLIALIVLLAIFGGRKVSKYGKEIASLKYEKTALTAQNALLDDKIKVQERENSKKQAVIDSCYVVFVAKDRVIAGLTGELDSALSQLEGITSDSSYQFLQRVAYVFPGTLEYLFNALQVKGIHADYLKARNAEQIIPEYEGLVANCKVQLAENDKLKAGLQSIIVDKTSQLINCEQINKDNEQIIKNTEKQRDKERHRKNFWRFGTGVMTGVAVILAVFGI